MAVITKYVVERHGVEKMTFVAKAEADAYDKMLDTAEDIQQLLARSALSADEQLVESVAFYLAQHKDELLQALGAKAKTAKKEKTELLERYKEQQLFKTSVIIKKARDCNGTPCFLLYQNIKEI